MLVVVAVGSDDDAAASRTLDGLGARVVERREVAPHRLLLFASPLPGAAPAEAVAASLRASGWAAAERPEAGGHLTAWHANTAPVVIGGRFCVCVPWAEFDRRASAPAVEIDPGGAFGTGAHPSTRLLLEELARRVGPGDRALDVGCGSGVLSVSAAHLGATVVATDIDPRALTATAANAARNRLGDRIAGHAGPLEELGGPFDAIVANIGADVLVDLAPALVRLAAPGGWMGLSGLSPAQVSVVEAAYRSFGRGQVLRDDEWAALVVTGRGERGPAGPRARPH